MLGFISRIYKDQNEFKIVVRLSSVFLFVFLLYLIASYFIIYNLSLNDIKQYLSRSTANVVSDFEYEGGKWNTDKYLSDIITPTEIPLYVFATDGLLMDRLNVIHGLLDTSNYEYASSFITPRTITSTAEETWRVYSHPIKRSDQTKGVILVAYFDPRGISEKEIDELLEVSAMSIDSKVQMIDGIIDVSGIRQKEIDPNISFEIVDTFNRSLQSYGGPPAYVDKSYIQDALGYKDFRRVIDMKTKSTYLVYAQPIIGGDQTVGVVVAGKNLDQFATTLKYQLWLSVVAGLLAIALFVIVVSYFYRHDISEIVQERLTNLANPAPPEIYSMSFNREKGSIVINKDIQIPIPLDSHQFDICNRLFQNPTKKLDTIDLAEAIGDQEASGNEARMVYDTVLSINDKVKRVLRLQLITRKNHQYCINSEIASKIHK